MDFDPTFALPSQASLFPIKTFAQLKITPNATQTSPADSIFIEDVQSTCPQAYQKQNSIFRKANPAVLLEISEQLIQRGFNPKKPLTVNSRQCFSPEEIELLVDALNAHFFYNGTQLEGIDSDFMTRLNTARSYSFYSRVFSQDPRS